MAQHDHWLPAFNFNIEEWSEDDRYKTQAIYRTLPLAHAVFAVVIEEKLTGRFMIRSQTCTPGIDVVRSRASAVQRFAIRLRPSDPRRLRLACRGQHRSATATAAQERKAALARVGRAPRTGSRPPTALSYRPKLTRRYKVLNRS